MLNRSVGLLFLLICLSAASFGQTFTSSQPGPWDVASTWGGAGVPSAANSTSIVVNHAVTVPNGFTATVDQVTVAGSIIVSSGGILDVANGTGNDLTLTGAGSLDVTGTVSKQDLAVIIGTTAGNTNFRSGSRYQHLNTASEGAVPLATWDANSTLEITSWTASKTLSSPTWSQSFGHLIYNCPAQVSTISFNGLLTNIQGDFIVQNSNSQPVQIVGNGQTRTLSIGGDFSVLGTCRLYLNINGDATVNIGRDFIYNSTNANGSYICSFGNTTLNLTRHFSMNAPGGLLYTGAGDPSTGIATFNVGSNFSLIAGTIRENGSSSQVVMNFSNSSVHTFVNTGTLTGTFDYNIAVNDELVITDPSYLGGTNGTGVTSDLTVNGRLVAESTDLLGAIRNGNTLGNIRTPFATRVFNSGSTVVYRSTTGQQFIGDGHPASAGVNVIIDNTNGISFASNVFAVNISGTLTLLNGNLNVTSTTGARTLTLSGDIVPNANFLAFSGPNSDLVINGAGAIAQLSFSPSAQSVRNFTLNRATGATLISGLTINTTGTLFLTSGDLVFNSQNLVLNGTSSVVAGRLSSNTASTLTIGGSAAFGTLPPFAGPSGNMLGTLTMNRSSAGSATVNGQIIITSTLNLTNGDLTNTSGLTLDNNATIVRSPTSQLLGNGVVSDPGESYNLIYSGSTITPGLELPAPSNTEDLNDLTVNGSVNLNQDVVINGSFNINSGTFSNGSFTITMDETGNWNDNAGIFNPGTGTVIFDGNTTIGGTSTPSFGIILVNSGATVTLPVGSVSVSGNITVQSGATFNANNGTITLTGATLQTISANGATFNNLTVNKLGASDVLLSSQLGLTGQLSIQASGIDVTSNGNLILRSISDGPTGNGSIGPLPGTANVVGDVVVQRYHSAEGPVNRYISSPVTNARVLDLQDDFPITGSFTGTSYPCTGCLNNGPSLRYYNEPTLGPFNKGYVQYPPIGGNNSSLLAVGRGYLAYMWQGASQITWDVTGPINKGTLSLPITVTPSSPPDPNADGWNLVGNPYPSSIDWDNASGWVKTNIAPTIYVWDDPAGVFRTWNGTTGDLPNGVIASCQSFWVYGTGSASLTINEQAKTSATGAFFRRRESYPELMFSISQGARKDNSFLIDTNGDKLEGDLNAKKLESEDLGISLRDTEGVKFVMYAPDKIQNDEVYALSVTSEIGKSYTLSFESHHGFKLDHWKLYDSQENIYVTLAKNNRYPFVGGESDAARFYLTRGEVGAVEDILSTVAIFPNPTSEKVNITWTGLTNAKLSILNSVGAQMTPFYTLAPQEAIEIDVRGWQNGLYIVQVAGGGKHLTRKVIKK
ncbi:MAG: T9SS type A sorting domain-containing protein [Cyclobacteriaceae bacterium]